MANGDRHMDIKGEYSMPTWFDDWELKHPNREPQFMLPKQFLENVVTKIQKEAIELTSVIERTEPDKFKARYMAWGSMLRQAIGDVLTGKKP